MFTSVGEPTNPSLFTMNPSKLYSGAAEDVFWSNSNAQNPKPLEYVLNVGGASFGVKDFPSLQTNESGADTKDQTNVKSNFCSLVGDKVFDGVNISNLRKVVKNAKYGLKQIMMNAKGFFFFKSDSRAGLEAVLEGGPWMVRNSSIILKKWSMNTSLQKEELTRILIWVKLHDVPIQVFEEDGISLIATYLRKPIMLDSNTSSMCKDSWGRSSFARCLIEINSEANFIDSITIGIPDLDGHVILRRLSELNTNGSRLDALIAIYLDTRKVVNRKRNNKGSSAGNKILKGVPVSKGFQVGKDFTYLPRASNVGSNGDNGTRGETYSKAGSSKNTNDGVSLNTMGTKDMQQDTGKKKIYNIASPNPFAALGVDDDEEEEFLMFSVASWNIRGLNRSPKQKEVRQVVNENNLSVCAILESHVDVVVVYDTCKKVCSRWKWTSNGNLCSKGSRIILGWNDDLVDVMIMAQTNQVMHVQVNMCANHKTFFCSFVYADNYYIDHRVLWSNLVGHVGLMRNRPWVLLGDFNAAFNLEDLSSGGYEPNAAMRELKECIQEKQSLPMGAISGRLFYYDFPIKLDSIKTIEVRSCILRDQEGGLRSVPLRDDKPKGFNGILKKIDRIMGNLQFNDDFPGSFAIFQPYRISDHSPCVLRIPTLKAGDSNAAYFHKIMKSKCARNRIEMVSDTSYNGNQVPGAFVNHYNQFLGAEGVTNPLDDHDLFTSVLDNAKADFMVRDVSNDEVKSVIFSMGDDRALGPDGFTAAFFKKAWDVVGGDITCAICDFFSNGKLLKELNHTIISLIPKVTTLARINDYHPISCCNVLYKCISKIITNRVKEGLGDIVSINQYAFVPGRRIYYNILLTQELMRNYHRRRGPPRCAFKVDIQKAYDTVDWGFIETILVGFGFHPKMRRVRNSNEFQYHHLCEPQRIINLCFADDLFLFARGHPSLVAVIMEALEEFKQVSGLVPSIPKSTTFFCNVLNAIKASILNSMPFAEGALLVLSSMHIYWASVFILPTRIVNDLEQLMRGFLWCQWEMKKRKAKVAWDSVCVPKHEGGLGIRRIDDFNVALMATHIWSILAYMESLWVKWVHTYKLKGRSFWDVPFRGDVSWGWFHAIAQLQVPSLLDDIDDVILWRDWDGDLRPFSVACAWDTIRPRVAIQKLKTQHRLRQWDVGPSIDLNLLRCLLCDLVPDSHDHLFFECSFSSQVWSKVRGLCGMDVIPPRLIDVLAFVIPIYKGRTAVSILCRIVVAANSYYIWLERNGRLFKKTSSPDQIADVIISMVRLKLVTFKFKKIYVGSRLLLDQWKIPSYCIVHDGSTR
ncbi:sodium/hydrogen exchanger 6 [Tanacetum coccineum]